MLTNMARTCRCTPCPPSAPSRAPRNLRAAAEELHLTHSAVSQQIRAARRRSSASQLFERRGRRIVLNAAGAALLRSVEPALDQLDDGVHAAAAAASGARAAAARDRAALVRAALAAAAHGRWREQPSRHRARDSTPRSRWSTCSARASTPRCARATARGAGCDAERLIDSPRVIVVGSPAGRAAPARRATPRRWRASRCSATPTCGSAGSRRRRDATRVNPVAAFNDAGLMLQAAEQNLGIALSRELLAADALRDGRLFRLSPLALHDETVDAYWLAYPPACATGAPLAALRRWLRDDRCIRARLVAATLRCSPAAHAGCGAAARRQDGRQEQRLQVATGSRSRARVGRTRRRSRSIRPRRSACASARLDRRQRQPGALDEQRCVEAFAQAQRVEHELERQLRRAATSCSLRHRLRRPAPASM